MKHSPCKQPLNAGELVEYWLGETDPERAAACEEHLFACEGCSSRLESVVGLGTAVRELLRQGKIAAVLTPASLDKLKATGLRVREYPVDPGGSVNCTIAPDDDLVVSRLRAPLAGVRKLDLVFEDIETATNFRLHDIGLDLTRGEILVMPKAEYLRSLHQATQRMRLFAIDGAEERLLGEYTFHHTRHPGLK